MAGTYTLLARGETVQETIGRAVSESALSRYFGFRQVRVDFIKRGLGVRCR